MIPSPSQQFETPRPDVEIGRIRELTRQQRYDEALRGVESLRLVEPKSRDVLYLLAVNQRCLGKISAALATLEQLEREHLPLGRLYQERGYCYMSLRDAPRALLAFERAASLNPALIASWSALESLYRMTGAADKAATAAEQLASLKRLPPEIVQAGSLFSDGEFGAAERLLVTALNVSPDYHAARLDYARVLLARQDHAHAGEQLKILLRFDPDNAEYRALNATAAAGCGDHQDAILAYQALLTPVPESAHLHLLLGHSLKAVGRQQDAIDCYYAALEARPAFGDAYWSLANLKTHRFSASDLADMRAAIASDSAPLPDRIHLHFSLGHALEGREEYAESWTHYARGNALKRADSRYRPEFTELNAQNQIQFCTREFVAAHAGVGIPESGPIFIVGLPRSGSTLVEQILASHSLVEGTQELHDIPRIVQELRSYPAALRDLEPQEFRKLGERYLNETRAYRKRGTPFFVDKMPNNFRHIGLIHLMLPNAKIIDARREPMACCFSNLKQLFAGGQEFSYDQEFMARYYRSYLELMRHWDEVLPGRILRVFHEDIVEDLQGSVRRLLDYCGLEFEPGCVDFHKTSRTVSTASSEQVRRPISRDGLLQWRHYRPWLEQLEQTLGDAPLRYREP
jgi:tetratricopeptide (TPR) repeat protein